MRPPALPRCGGSWTALFEGGQCLLAATARPSRLQTNCRSASPENHCDNGDGRRDSVEKPNLQCRQTKFLDDLRRTIVSRVCGFMVIRMVILALMTPYLRPTPGGR
jgi:hypothetical protein